MLGSGGTLALNSAFDKDEGDTAFLHNPPRPPRLLTLFTLIVMAIGLAIALFISVRFVVAYLVCFVMSVIYSVPPFRMKSRPGMDMLISASGYGAMTVYSGWAALNRPLIPPIPSVVAAFFFSLPGILSPSSTRWKRIGGGATGPCRLSSASATG